MIQHTIVTGYIAWHTVSADAMDEVFRAAEDWCLPGVTITRAEGWAPRWGSEPVLVITVLCPSERGFQAVERFAESLRDTFKQECVLHTYTTVEGGML